MKSQFLLLIPLLTLFCNRVCAAGDPPCPLQRAAAADGAILLLCARDQVIVSHDEGKSWRLSKLPEETRLRAAVLLDRRRGFVTGDGGALFATSDGAETWTRIDLPTRENLTAIFFFGEHGWVAGWAGVILHSSDAGRTWKKQNSGVFQGLESLHFVDAKNGWAAGWAGTILRTIDGGETWQRVQTDTLWSLNSIYFRDREHGWAAGFGGQILRTRDGGLTWSEQPAPLREWMQSVAFDQSGRGWIAAGQHVLMSEDSGETWKALPVGGTPFLHQMLPLRGALWAVGQFAVLQLDDAGRGFNRITTLPSRENEIPKVQLNSRRNVYDTETTL